MITSFSEYKPIVFFLVGAGLIISGVFIGYELAQQNENKLAQENYERIKDLQAGITSHSLNSGMHGGFRP